MECRSMCLLVALIAAFAACDGLTESAVDIVMLSEQETQTPVVGGPPTYAEIPGFKFNFNSHPAKVESREECEQLCSSQLKCKSYSFAKKTLECEWSTDKMQYDPDFVFNFKPANGKTYHTFPGLLYRATGWLKSEKKTNKECAALCDQAAACAAFSYRARDQLCMLTGHAIGFHEDFNYYEKEGGHKEFALRPHEAHAPKTATIPGSGAAGGAAGAASDPATVAQQAAQAVATAIAGAAAPAPPAPAGEPESVVAQRLQAVKDWAAQKIQQEDEETQLKIRAHEVDNKAQMEKQQEDSAEAQAEEKINEAKKEAQKEADRAATDAQDKAASMVAKVKLEAKEASVSAELSQAAAEKRQAAVTVEKANKKLENVKEIDEKTDKVREQEQAEKSKDKTNADMQLRLVREKDTKANQAAIATAVAENTAQVRKEMAAKSKTALEETAERQEKMVDEERARKSTRAVEVNAKTDAKNALQSQKDKLETDLAAANKATADATAHEITSKSQMRVSLNSEDMATDAKIKANEMEAKKTAEEETFNAEMAAQHSDEQLRKSARVETDMESQSKEAVGKSTDTSCDGELKQMQQQAVQEETQAANAASSMPAPEGQKLLDDKKQEWADRILAKQQACIPTEVDFTVDVAPLASASVSVTPPAGPPAEESVELLETLESSDPDPQLPPIDPWPLGHPIRETYADGSLKTTVPFHGRAADDPSTRLAESNAAMQNGFQPIESGANEQIAYHKFKVADLKSGENIHSAVLKFRKEGGPESECIVKLTQCDYDPATLTYANRPAIINTVSSGGIFPAADGLVSIPLDTSLVTSALTGHMDHILCVEITGGAPNNPVYMNELTLAVRIMKDPTVVDTTDRRRRTTPDVEMARRRRTALADSRRRRSVQAVKSKAEEFYEKNQARYTPQYEEEMTAKLPQAIAGRKLEIEHEMRQRYKGIIKDTVEATLNAQFNKDAEIEALQEEDKVTIEAALASTFPQKYADEKEKLREQMKNDLTVQMTAAEDKVIEAEATVMADDTVKSDSRALLDGAIQQKIVQDLPAALQAEVEKNAPKDYSAAIEPVVVKSIEDKTMETVDKAVEKEIQLQITAQETSTATSAATAAVSSRMTELATQKIAEEVQSEKSTNALGLASKLNSGGQDEQDALLIIEQNVANMPSLLSASEQQAIEQSAANTAVAALRTKIQDEAEWKIRTPAFIDNVMYELKKSETARITPIIKADILNGLQTELEPAVKEQVTKKVTDEVNSQEKQVLKTLHAALVQKNKADLMPKMNAKLEEAIPEAQESAKFAAEVEAAQLELKETLKEEMEQELREPMERVAKLKVKADMDTRREVIKLQVKAEKETELNSQVSEQTADSRIEPEVERLMQSTMQIKLLEKCKAETKKQVDQQLGPTLKEVIMKKYEKGTLAEARAFVQQNKESKIRAQIESKMKKSVDTLVQNKLGDARADLRKQVLEKLEKELYDKAAADGADQLHDDTMGMSTQNAGAVELARHNEWKFKAEQDAEVQVDIEMQSGLVDQLQTRLTMEERAAAMANLEADIQSESERQAKDISDKALEQKYQDDMDAMEIGKAHASEMASEDSEHSAPDVVDSAAVNSGLAASAAALLAGGETEDESGLTPEQILALSNMSNASNATMPPTPPPTEPMPDNATNTTNMTNSTNSTEEQLVYDTFDEDYFKLS